MWLPAVWAQRCPLVDPMCRKPGSDDIDAVQCKHRNEPLNPLAQLVPDRAQPEFGLERPECGCSRVGANRILNAPLRPQHNGPHGYRASYAALRFQVTALALPSEPS